MESGLVRGVPAREDERISALQKFLLDDERRPGEPEDVATRLKERLLQAREMPEHAAALALIADWSPR